MLSRGIPGYTKQTHRLIDNDNMLSTISSSTSVWEIWSVLWRTESRKYVDCSSSSTPLFKSITSHPVGELFIFTRSLECQGQVFDIMQGAWDCCTDDVTNSWSLLWLRHWTWPVSPVQTSNFTCAELNARVKCMWSATFETIGHFRVPKTLTFKMRLGAQPFLWKWVLFAWEWKWFPYQRLSTYPRFETEARGNSEMA